MHCTSLCDITHGALTEKAAFRACREGLEIPLRTVHLDERSPDLVGATEGKTPCIMGRSSEGWEMVLDTAQLESCDQSVEAFESMRRARLEG